MSEQAFFSHHSPEPGAATVADRVRATGLALDAVGENLARLQGNATPAAAVAGWMRSPGHRKNLLTAAWETSGVGIAEDERGNAFFTQLFGIPAALELTGVALEVEPITRYVVRIRAQVGRGRELVGFVRNEYADRVGADVHGIATLELEVARGAGRVHVSVGQAKRNASDCIGIFDGWAEIAPDGEGTWNPGWQKDGAKILDHGLVRARSTELRTSFCGFARRDLILVVDGVRERAFPAGGQFEHRLTFLAHGGSRCIDLGIPGMDGRYEVKSRFVLDTDAGTLMEARS